MSLVKPITPHLWFNTEAREAAEFYCSVFPDSKIDSITQIHDTPSGDCDVVTFTLGGHPFMSISAGPLFKFNPAISFMVHFDPAKDPKAREKLDALWEKLGDGGSALMPLQAYDFSGHYGWMQDRYGVSWQLMLTDKKHESRPFIVPTLMFTGQNAGKAEEAGAFYRSVFDDSKEGTIARYPEGSAPDVPGTVMYSDFRLDQTWMAAMDSAHGHGFGFNEAISFVVTCRDQAEIDRFWEPLSSVPEAEQCGWCKDRFGLSWQITPQVLDQYMTSGDQALVNRVTRAFLDMHKLDVARIEAAARAG